MMGVDFDLPKEVLSVLPSDPFEQLDLARRITSMAITLRVSKLEADEKKLMQKVADRDRIIYELQNRLSDTEHHLQEATTRLTKALDEQTKLSSERNALLSTVKKLDRDVAKLETFKKTLMQSLQDDDEGGKQTLENRFKDMLPRASPPMTREYGPDDSSLPRSVSMTPTVQTPKYTPTGSPKYADILPRPGTASGQDEFAGADDSSLPRSGMSPRSMSLTPKYTPTGSPGGTPVQMSAPGSPTRQSGGTKFLSLPGSHTSTAPSSPPLIKGMPVRTPKVDGKEFFRQARNRLTYEQFSSFLANIKELNAHRQTREETMRKASEIFGIDNKDLCLAFEGLLSRHLPS